MERRKNGIPLEKNGSSPCTYDNTACPHRVDIQPSPSDPLLTGLILLHYVIGSWQTFVTVPLNYQRTVVVNWNNASVVVIAAHVTQKPDTFFVLDVAGRVSNGFSTVTEDRSSLHRFQISWLEEM
jgi:hypothetical protein